MVKMNPFIANDDFDLSNEIEWKSARAAIPQPQAETVQ